MTKIKKINYIFCGLLIVIGYFLINFLVGQKILNNQQTGILIFCLINIMLAISLNVTVGNLGQITLGHAGFVSIGAYTSALLTKSGMFKGVPGYVTAVIIGGLVAGIVGIIIGIPALRLKGDYLAITTLAFGEIIRVIMENMKITGGAQGLSGIPRYRHFSYIYIFTVISFVLIYSIMTSRHGRAILSIREDEIAAQASGINTIYYKTLAFTISAIFAGIAGGILAHYVGVINARTFDYNYSINILVMVVLGGMGSFTGATFSAIALTVLPEVLRGFSNYRMIVYSLVLILIMIFRPTGIMGRKEFHLTNILKKFIKDKEVGDI